MLPLLIGLALQTAGGGQAPEIIVRAARTERALADCLAAGCATDDDVRLSMADAEARFANGDYRGARDTLGRAIDRTRPAAARYPRWVAALYEARATVNLHHGDMEAYRTSIAGQARTLRAHLPAGDPQVLMVTIQLGDAWLKQRDAFEARRQFAAAARGFTDRGDHGLAALSTLRIASVALARGRLGEARSIVERITRGPGGADPAVARAAAVMSARIGARANDDRSVEKLLATLRTDAGKPPMLISEARYVPDTQERLSNDALGGRNVGTPRPGDLRPLLSTDIGYSIEADGSVSDIEILRGSRNQDWAGPLVPRIASRRYAPIAVPPGHPGLYRIERFTRRANQVMATGSLTRRAAGAIQIESLDLTRDPAAAAPAS